MFSTSCWFFQYLTIGWIKWRRKIRFGYIKSNNQISSSSSSFSYMVFFTIPRNNAMNFLLQFFLTIQFILYIEREMDIFFSLSTHFILKSIFFCWILFMENGRYFFVVEKLDSLDQMVRSMITLDDVDDFRSKLLNFQNKNFSSNKNKNSEYMILNGPKV